MSTEPLSILHVAAPGAVGGLESVVQSLAIGQHRAGHRVLVALVVEPDQELNGLLTPFLTAAVDVRVLRVPPRAYVRERRLIRELCVQFRPDVVHTHGCRSDVLDAGVARSLGIATVTTVHGSSRLGGITRLYELLEFALFRRFDAVVAVSRPLVRSLRRFGVATDRIHVIPNGWNGRVPGPDRRAARQALGLPQDEFLIGWVGRLIPVKGPDVFLEALAELTDLSWSASIVGDGSERRRLERMCSRLRLGRRVTFHGQVDDAAGRLHAFDTVVLSSRSEGTPMVLLEAIAAGVPVVTTAVGGVPDVIGPGEGLLVPPERPTALAQAIRNVQAHPAAAKQRAEAARVRLAVEFGPERWLARYEEIYRDVRRTGARAQHPSAVGASRNGGRDHAP
jgi:glycosyltransferase involved in cell wall biosynthesis